MNGITDLKTLLSTLQPMLHTDQFVFCSQKTKLLNTIRLDPIATFKEKEGLTLILTKQTADSEGLSYEGVFNMITLNVHSSLEAVGLTAAVSSALAEQNISANVIAAFYHDHVFVAEKDADKALAVLNSLQAHN